MLSRGCVGELLVLNSCARLTLLLTPNDLPRCFLLTFSGCWNRLDVSMPLKPSFLSRCIGILCRLSITSRLRRICSVSPWRISLIDWNSLRIFSHGGDCTYLLLIQCLKRLRIVGNWVCARSSLDRPFLPLRSLIIARRNTPISEDIGWVPIQVGYGVSACGPGPVIQRCLISGLGFVLITCQSDWGQMRIYCPICLYYFLGRS